MYNRPPYILDTPALLYGFVNPMNDNYTVLGVENELKRKFSMSLSDLPCGEFVSTRVASGKLCQAVRRKASETGDLQLLSATDVSLIALAVELVYETRLSATLVSDDFALLNTAGHFGINRQMVTQERERFELLVWQWFCPCCRKIGRLGETECPDCGVRLKRRSRVSKKSR